MCGSKLTPDIQRNSPFRENATLNSPVSNMSACDVMTTNRKFRYMRETTDKYG